MDSLNDNSNEFKCLGNFHFDDNLLYTLGAKNLLVPIEAATDFVRYQTEPSPS